MVEVEAKKSNQQVVMTCWCLVWPAWLREKQKKQPMSHKGSLVLVMACMVEGEAKKAPMSHKGSLVLVVAGMVEG